MKHSHKTFFAFLALGIIAGAALFAFTHVAQALTIENVGGTLTLGDADLKQTIINVIKWALGLLGLVALIVMLYGGFLWLTSRGDTKQIDKAKRTLINGAIGIVIILVSWAIVLFVQRFITGSTGTANAASCTVGSTSQNLCADCVQNPADPGNPNNGIWVDNHSCLPPNPSYSWNVLSQVPRIAETNVSLCASPQERFGGLRDENANSLPDENNASSGTYTVDELDSNGNPVAPSVVGNTILPSNQTATFFHPNNDFKPNTSYRVTHDNFFSSTPLPLPLTLPAASWVFTTGTAGDDEPPTVVASYPTGTVNCLQPEMQVRFSEPMLGPSMDIDNVTLTSVPPTTAKIISLTVAPAQNGFSLVLDRPLNPNSTVTIRLNADTSTTLQTSTHGTQYLPGLKDSCVNALDGNGNGQSDGAGTDDYTWSFQIGNTTQQACNPKITSIEPTGFYGNTRTNANEALIIQGENFGLGGFGSVAFTGTEAVATDVSGPNSSCFNPTAGTGHFRPKQTDSVSCFVDADWEQNRITTLVPAGITPSANPNLFTGGAVDGGVFVQTGITSNVDNIDIQTPHIDWISPRDGRAGTFVTIAGSHFGTSGTVHFRHADGSSVSGTIPACAGANGWAQGQIVVQVPEGFGLNEIVDIQVENGSLAGAPGRSNLHKFTVSDTTHPGLCSIVPSCHPTGGGTLEARGEGLGNNLGLIESLYIPSNGGAAYNGTESNLNVGAGTLDVQAQAGLPNDQNYRFQLTVNGQATNPLQYRIPCDPPPQVVESASCSATQVPSPNPRPNSTDMCRNSIIQAEFNVDMSVGTLIAANMQVQDCGDADVFDAAACTTTVTGSASAPTNRLIRFAPGADMVGKHWYQVTIRRDVQNTGGANMNQDYVWHFRVRDSAEDCTAQMVTVQPNYRLMSTAQTQAFVATPMQNNCNLIATAASFAWNTSDAALTGPITLSTATSPNDTGTLTIPAGANNGTAVLVAQADGKSGSATVQVQRGVCETNADCSMCAGSTCQEVSPGNKRCTASITGMTATGPAGNLVTIDGCYFGAYKGSGTVRFDQNPAADPVPVEGNFNICGPGTWTDTQITLGHEPKDAATGGPAWQVQVQPDGAGVNPSPWFTGYTVSGMCETNTGVPVTVPADGVPQLCSIAPSTAKAADPITYTGARFNPSGSGAANDSRVFFQRTTGGVTSWIPAQNSGSFSTTQGSGVQAGNTIDSPSQTKVGKPITATPGLYCLSNHKDFTLRCDTNAECSSGCCSGNQCQPDLTQCTEGLVLSVVPSNTTLQCRNSAFTITFAADMQGSTLTAANIKLRLSPGGVEIPTDLHILGSRVVRLNPKTPLARNTNIEVIIRGSQSGVLSAAGKFMTADYISGSVQVAADATICSVNRVSVVRYFNTPITEDLFSCSGNSCSGDIDGANGNQHGYWAVALSTGGELLTAESQVWTEADTGGTPGQTNTYTGGLQQGLCEGAATGPDQVYCVTALNVANGTENLTVRVTAANNAGTGTATIPIRTFLCANPWPSPPDSYPFRDATFNFETSFCRDSLPDYTLQPVNTGSSASDSDILQEYLFTVQKNGVGTGDALGIRVFINFNHLSPEKWYKLKQGVAPSGGATTVDGFPAIREGRTVYVAAPNLFNDQYYPNIYVISHTDNASNETVQIFENILKNFRLALFASTTEKTALQRDMVRFHSYWDLVYSLEDRRVKQGSYPKLETGSYLKGISTTHWPSWNQSFAQELGKTPPKDPQDTWDPTLVTSRCPTTSGYEQSTCWSESLKRFQFPNEPANNPPLSKGILYSYPGTALYGTVEAVQHAWGAFTITRNFMSAAVLTDDPCSAFSGSRCNGFNVKIPGSFFDDIVNAAVVSQSDTTAPTVSITSPAAGGISGIVSFIATAQDNAAGTGIENVTFTLQGASTVSRVETVPFQPGRYRFIVNTQGLANGTYQLTARAFDRAGNPSTPAQRTYTVSNTSSTPDNLAPTVSFTQPSAAGSVLAKNVANTIAAFADDQLTGGSGIASITFYLSRTASFSGAPQANETLGQSPGTACGGAACPLFYTGSVTIPQSTLATYTNGSKTLRAVARDVAGNTSTVDLLVNVETTATNDARPIITAYSPNGTSALPLGSPVTIQIQASDDHALAGMSVSVLTATPPYVNIPIPNDSVAYPATPPTLSATHTFSWTPTQAGQYTFVFQANDFLPQVAATTVLITVADMNVPPAITLAQPTNGATVLTSTIVPIRATITDTNNNLDTLAVRIDDLTTPSASFDYPNLTNYYSTSSTSSWNLNIPDWTPAAAHNYRIRITATDTSSAQGQVEVTISVNASVPVQCGPASLGVTCMSGTQQCCDFSACNNTAVCAPISGTCVSPACT